VVHVPKTEPTTDEPEVAALFRLGYRVFVAPMELYWFANGPLARVFSGTRTSKRAPAPQPDEADDYPPPIQPRRLAQLLELSIKGQEPALERVAHAVCVQLAKHAPARPGTILLLGPTGTGKTSTIEALPEALSAAGHPKTHVFRVDCNELTQAFQVSRLIGAPPGYVGYSDTPRMLRALEEPGCILLLDEIEKAHPSVLEEVLLNFIDTGRLMTPRGTTIDAAHAVIAMTSNLAADELESRLHQIPLDNRWAVQRECRLLLHEEGVPSELLGRIGTFAVFQQLGTDDLRAAASLAVQALACEYGLELLSVEPIVAEVVLDIAGQSGLGARTLPHAATELLAEALMDAVERGVSGPASIDPGPPISVRASLHAA
jgi:ATP-dependent Clp protease ATP-binding subunit ClpA